MQSQKLITLFNFLLNNRKYNKSVQEGFYKSVINPRHNTESNVISLLHHIANTQSQPNIDKLAEFFKLIHKNSSKLATYKDFVLLLNQNKAVNDFRYIDLFEGLQSQSGWGNKTAALFVKSIYHIHCGDYGRSLKIWKDAPKSINQDDHFKLPVDAVIEHVFLKIECCNSVSFHGINNFLSSSNLYKGELMEVWDDLWFWGFITQKGGGENRVMGWNENKYWALLHTDKNPNVIKEIEKKAKIFKSIIES